MSVDQALKILNNNDSGRVYSRKEAALLMDFYGKLAEDASRNRQRFHSKTKLKVA